MDRALLKEREELKNNIISLSTECAELQYKKEAVERELRKAIKELEAFESELKKKLMNIRNRES